MTLQESHARPSMDKEEMKESARRFFRRHCAIQTLRDMRGPRSHFLTKRIGQGYTTVEWNPIHPQCLRLTISYRGQQWNIRAPKVHP